MRLINNPALACFAALLLAAPLAPSTGAQKVVVEAGRVITQAGPDIEDGVIVIEDGRITAIGVKGEVQVPLDAPVVGGPDLVAFPGFVEAHSNRGMDRANESPDIAPFLNIRDSIDPVNFFFEDCLRYGITTINVQHANECVIGAQGMVVRPVGLTVEEMIVRPESGVKISINPKSGKSAATQAQTLRRAFVELEDYLEQLVKDARDGNDHARREALYQGRDLEGEAGKGRAMTSTAWKVDGLEIVPRGEIDEKQAPLLDLVEGRLHAFIYCGQPNQVHTALAVARENGFLANSTFVLDTRCWKAADTVAESGVPVILTGSQVVTERDPVTGEEIETFAPGVFSDAGVRYAMSSTDSGPHSLWYQAATAVGQGLDRQTALDAVTRVPADVLGLGDRVGSLEVGKDGNVLLLTGDPLSVTSWVEHVVLEGDRVYDRAADIRNKHLLEGIAPPGALSALATAGAPPESHDEDAEDGDDDDEKED